MKPFFRLFLSLFGGFYAVEKIIYKLKFLGLWFRLFNFKIIYDSALGLDLGYGDMNKIIVSLGLMVYFLNVRNRLEACFNLSLNRLLNHLFLAI